VPIIYDASNQGYTWCKTTDPGFQSFATLRAQIWAEFHIPHRLFRPIAFRSHTYSKMPQSIRKWTTVCGIQCSVCPLNATQQVVPLSNWQRKATHLCHSLHIWAQNAALEWNPSRAILHWKFPCLKCHIFLTCDLQSVKYIQVRGGLFRL
jgi:hypothetical protein